MIGDQVFASALPLALVKTPPNRMDGCADSVPLGNVDKKFGRCFTLLLTSGSG